MKETERQRLKEIIESQKTQTDKDIEDKSYYIGVRLYKISELNKQINADATLLEIFKKKKNSFRNRKQISKRVAG